MDIYTQPALGKRKENPSELDVPPKRLKQLGGGPSGEATEYVPIHNGTAIIEGPSNAPADGTQAGGSQTTRTLRANSRLRRIPKRSFSFQSTFDTTSNPQLRTESTWLQDVEMMDPDATPRAQPGNIPGESSAAPAPKRQLRPRVVSRTLSTASAPAGPSKPKERRRGRKKSELPDRTPPAPFKIDLPSHLGFPDPPKIDITRAFVPPGLFVAGGAGTSGLVPTNFPGQPDLTQWQAASSRCADPSSPAELAPNREHPSRWRGDPASTSGKETTNSSDK
ncbi:hypothetical protein NMY22_g19798 [Coprinellus aureogranulatus]|nr:hypothetical protein NMY22_g19798 [Coprinellus aureogranulatus]